MVQAHNPNTRSPAHREASSRNRLPAQLLFGATILAGPAIVLLAIADQGPWTPSHERLFLSTNAGLPLSIFWVLSIALGFTRTDKSFLQVLIAAFSTLTVFVFSGIIIWIVVFIAAGMRGFCMGAIVSVAFVFIGLGASITHIWLLPILKYRAWQFLAFLVAPSGALYILAATNPAGICPEIDLLPRNFWADLPALVALVPGVALVVTVTQPIALSRAILVLLIALLPIYAAKSAIDHESYSLTESIFWPIRAQSEFITRAERELLIERATRLRPGEPVRIGEHWYRFEQFGKWNPFSDKARRPDRIVLARIDIPTEAINLPNLRFPQKPYVQLLIRTNPSIDRANAGNNIIRTRYMDLEIFVLESTIEGADHALIRRRIEEFMDAARAGAP